MIAYCLSVAAVTLVVGLAAAVLVRLLPTVRLQLMALALLASILPLAAVLVSGTVMFSSDHDYEVLLVTVPAAAAAVVGGVAIARAISRPIEQTSDAALQAAAGDLAARAPVTGPRELSSLATSFNEMTSSVERLFDARSELVAWASHDLRTPLASMRAMLEATEDGIVPPGHYDAALREQVDAMSALVADLFELAKIDAGALALELREARLGSLVEASVRSVQAEAQARQIEVRSELPDALPAVRCAPESVERVLANLIANALRHTPARGSVSVRVVPHDDEVVVTVDDTGSGIPPHALDRVFDRFFRGDSARVGGGAGLGLAIARGLVEAQGGRIWAERPPHGGARVAFTLPAA